MTILSYGYDAGSVAEQPWAAMSGYLGHDPTVAAASDWAVSVVAGQARQVRVAAGTGFGRGVLDISDTAVTLTLPVASGTQYATVYAHRDWDDNETTFLYSGYYSTPDVVAGGLANNPGVSDDQPLAVVRVIGAAVVVTKDMRTPIDEARSGWKAWQALTLAGSTLSHPSNGFPPQFALSIDGKRAKLRGTISRTTSFDLANNMVIAVEEDIAPIHSVYVEVSTENQFVGNVGANELWDTSARLEINQAGQVIFINSNRPTWVDITCQFDLS